MGAATAMEPWARDGRPGAAFGVLLPVSLQLPERTIPTFRVTNAAGSEVLRFDYAGDYGGALLEAKRQILHTVASPAEGGPQLFDLMLGAELVAEVEIRVEGSLESWARAYKP